MGYILNADYRQSVGVYVPAPSDKNASPKTMWWYDKLAYQAKYLASVGVTQALLPQASKCAGADQPGSEYDTFDFFDLGSKNQQGAIPTRFGYREQLMRCVAIFASNGIDCWEDFVTHQMGGGKNMVYTYVGPDGKTLNGRLPLFASCFSNYIVNPDGSLTRMEGCVPLDPIFGPQQFDVGIYAFGDLLAPVNALPKNYVMTGLQQAIDFHMRSIGYKGTRDDDAKGQAVETAQKVFGYSTVKDFPFVGEVIDAPETVAQWINEVGLPNCYAFDFSFQGMVKGMCNNTSRWDMRQWMNPTCCLAAMWPEKAVTLVENMDTDTNGTETVVWNKRLGYAFMSVFMGWPSLYYKDWSTDPGCYGWGLQSFLNNAMWAQEFLAKGDLVWRYGSYQLIAFERMGTGLIAAFNNDMYNGWYTITLHTARPNTEYKDFSGNNGMNCWSDGNGTLTFGVPPNNNGGGYVYFAPVGYDQEFFRLGKKITQTFFGAPDLDIGNAINEKVAIPFGVWCADGEIIDVKITANTEGWTPTSSVVVQASDGDDDNFLTVTQSQESSDEGTSLASHGLTTFAITGTNLPAGGSTFEMDVTYKAPATITEDEIFAGAYYES